MAEGREPVIVVVSVPFSEAEYKQLQDEAALTPAGTSAQAVRSRMKLQPAPLRSKSLPHVSISEYARMAAGRG